jgi:cellulose synthase/poly-beta-1,6-N-acetylglucosamine synthase-like glycosyltransferase
MQSGRIEYEIIIIDDHSRDETRSKIRTFRNKIPIRGYLKKGKPGKAYSLIEGFKRARYDTVAMIDADLQYPPEAIPDMLKIIASGQADVVVANRSQVHMGILRTFMSQTFRYIFGKLLWKIDVDVQSGLKVFKKEVFERASLNPQPWTFDLEFLTQAKSGGYRINSFDNVFSPRETGKAKIDIIASSYQLVKHALSLRLTQKHYIPFSKSQSHLFGRGFHYKGEKYVTHNALGYEQTAVGRTTLYQRCILLMGFLLFVLLAATETHKFLLIIVSIVTVLYFLDLLFNFFLIYRSFFRYNEITATIEEQSKVPIWPRYTVFCPLYKEAKIIPQFLQAMNQLDYPKDKLEVLLLLEEDDTDTLEKVKSMALPDFIQIMVVPEGMPKTKPKACNYGLANATGKFAVIYDAEDIPAPDQLKKAVIAFGKAGNNVACIQAKLNYYNWNQNLLTRLFTLEYSLWFNLILTGLQSITAPIPLGGTSNHFRTSDLISLGGWDPFNVTEDADLGMRIAKRGMTTAILDSTTMEEANSQYGNWLKQRSRWIKGYMQTYLVHMRNLKQFAQTGKRRNMITFQLIIGGKIMSMLINPLLWLLTILYFIFRPEIGNLVQSFYLTPIFYMGAFALVFGNFLYMYYYMMGASRQGRPELIPYAIFVPMYWLMMSIASVYALHDLIVRPFHWHKTKHGLHLVDEVERDNIDQYMVEPVI